jgi:RNA polymerase sigma-B factor
MAQDLHGAEVAVATADDDALAQFRTYRTTRDPALRDTIVDRHLHLVLSVARRFSGLGESFDDLTQEGAIGLLNAVDLFDPARGVKFSTYACHLIASQIQHYLRDRGRLIRQPAWVQELNTKLTRTAEGLAQELGRDPMPEELAARLNVSADTVSHVLAARELNKVVSLSVPADGNDADTPQTDREVAVPVKTGVPWGVEDTLEIDAAIDTLKPLEQQVVRHFFFGDLTQTEIAHTLGISVNYASYLLRRAQTKIKTYLDEQRKQEAAVLADAAVIAPAGAFDAPILDPVTGLNSAAYLRARVEEEVARSRRYPTNFTLMYAKVTGVPDDAATRQAVLSTVGQLMRGSIRVVDLLGHAQDGLFLLLLPHTGREARVLGERLCQRIGGRELTAMAGAGLLHVAIGYAVFPMDGAGADGLFAATEKALRAAEKAGPNGVSGAVKARR